MVRAGAPKDERKANRRGAARLAAVQALYQMDIAGTGLNDILAEFESHWIGREVEGAQYLPAEATFFRDVVSGVVREQRSLDPLVDKVLAQGWPLKRIEAILRAVLRAGAYELGHRSDVPARVVVSEYVDVANAFVARDETGMVNAVLDQIARQFRAGEFAPVTRRSVPYERQGAGAAKIRRRIPSDRIDRKVVFGHALEKTLHCDRGNEPRHLAAEAEVLAGAKAEMALRVTIDVVDIRVRKLPPIAIAGAECKRHLVANVHCFPVQLGLAHDRALETLRRGVEAQRLLDRRFDQRGVGDDAAARIGMIVQIEREHAHEARERFHSCHDEGRRREHDLALAQSVAVDLGFGEMGDEVVGRLRAAQSHLGGEEVAELLEGGDVLRVAALHGLVGRDRENDLAPDVGMVALRQAHGAKEHADRDLAGEIVDELEVFSLAYTRERAVGNLESGGNELLDVPAGERGLAERP